MTAEESLCRLHEDLFGSAPDSIRLLSGAGSNRRYFRLSSVTADQHLSVIGTAGTDVDENRAFIGLSRHLAGRGIAVPEVLAVSSDGITYLQEDLGDVSLFDVISPESRTGEFSSETISLLERVMQLLADTHSRASEGLDWNLCFPQKEMDGNMVRWDLNYFKYCFLKNAGVEFAEPLLESEFNLLYERLTERAEAADGFMIRDFQSRNVMIKDGKPYLIDFQGGRRGPAEYDVASFLWQAKARFTPGLREHLVNTYVKARNVSTPEFNEEAFRKALPLFVMFRMMQTLGAYGLRGLAEKKPHFITSIPIALRNLQAHLRAYGLTGIFPHIAEITGRSLAAATIGDIDTMAGIEPFTDGLTVTVSSFSYKRGIPTDLSGNGGGFVFDCRAVHNPGRYAEYRQLTGRDKPVRQFLENDGEIFEFLGHVNALVDASVKRYISRGFTSLSVNFGCTGGQHRSVYSAEATARHLARTFPGIRVILWHREQHILEIIDPVAEKS